MRITKLNLKIIPDSRGQDTLEATLGADNLVSTASVPSGKSKGKFETTTIDPQTALEKLEGFKNEIQSMDFSQVLEFDNFLIKMDGTADKSNLGGNLILVLSIAFTKLLARVNNMQTHELIGQIYGKKSEKFPFLFFNLIGGGLHAQNSLPFQEYLLVTKFDSPSKGLEYAKKVMGKLRDDIAKNFGDLRLGDEGSFTIDSRDPELGLKVLKRNAEDADVSLALDVAASTFYQNGSYHVGGKIMSSEELLSYYQPLTTNYQLFSIEDPFAEEDLEGFRNLTEKLGDKIWVVGDDLTTTNAARIKLAHEENCANAVIIKPNQIGSVSETINAVTLAKSYGWKIIVSHRSGETMDDFIADLAFGVGADGLKSGAPTQEERLVKYQRLIEIEKWRT